MVTVFEYKFLTVVRSRDQYIRIMFADKPNSFRRLLTDNDMLRILQYRAEQCTNSGRPCTDDEDSIFLRDFRDASGPKACGKYVSDKQRLLVTDRIGNMVQALIGIGYSDIFRLPSVDTAT